LPISNKKILGIIPARGGSKGVIRKNIRLLAGKPLIGYSIEAALKSEYLTEVVVSTDNIDISNISKSFGISVLMRPESLAQDTTPMLPVLQHTLLQVEEFSGVKYDYVMIIQPTAPMRSSADIDGSIKVIISQQCDSLVSLYQVEDCHPSRMYTIDDSIMNKVMNEPAGALRQELPAVFHRNGCIYLSSRELLVEQSIIISDRCFPYIMPASRSINIDTELDLEYAEFIFQRNLNK
jgi:CMP-N,N'-diacetyllegionaminic acid synthase